MLTERLGALYGAKTLVRVITCLIHNVTPRLSSMVARASIVPSFPRFYPQPTSRVRVIVPLTPIQLCLLHPLELLALLSPRNDE
jgi:hypothetical protein